MSGRCAEIFQRFFDYSYYKINKHGMTEAISHAVLMLFCISKVKFSIQNHALWNIFSGRYANFFFEFLDEIKIVIKTDCFADFSQAQRTRSQELLCLVDTQLR